MTAVVVKMTATVATLHAKARQAIDRGLDSFHEAAEYLAQAKKAGATVRDSADAIGMSKSWVQGLLAWRDSGYLTERPFQRLVQHAGQARLNALRRLILQHRSLPLATPEPATMWTRRFRRSARTKTCRRRQARRWRRTGAQRRRYGAGSVRGGRRRIYRRRDRRDVSKLQVSPSRSRSLSQRHPRTAGARDASRRSG